MSQFAIRTEAIGKQYHIGMATRPNLREALISACSAPKRYASRLFGRATANENTFWAVRNVSLDIRPGELVGLVGANGAGKSTLLKMLSRVTVPTVGRAIIRGRVGSMLEVGTGFHSELTGRENVFLSGAILGMSKMEIRRKFDEIVAFSEIEKFIDTAVKHYSSGMYLRLAFSVAAHLEPEVLFVDEVLAVGDVRFYSKCINKMRSLHASGMTIVLVSHHMFLVQTLCTRAVCMTHGRVLFDGDSLSAIVSYRKSLDEAAPVQSAPGSNSQSKRCRIHIFQLEPLGEWASYREPFSDSGMKLTFVADAEPNSLVGFRVAVSSAGGLFYYTFYSDPIRVPPSGRITCELQVPELMLLPGHYNVFGGMLKADEVNHFLAEETLQIFVRARGPAPAVDNGSGGNDNLFWNRGIWNMSGNTESGSQIQLQDECNRM
ncbi:MAG TPA: ABC transporter ATP-binding protein [Candidatus Acidoferrales bacterium]|nr:ABC transporter ATP-binding protein [Candidatus Acidoferrales bacterium]